MNRDFLPKKVDVPFSIAHFILYILRSILKKMSLFFKGLIIQMRSSGNELLTGFHLDEGKELSNMPAVINEGLLLDDGTASLLVQKVDLMP